MAQRPKAHVRTEIVSAAATLFAQVGYEATTVGAVAEQAGVSTGNVYRYFEGKKQLLAAVLPGSFASDLRRIIRERIAALGDARDVRQLAPDARYHVLSRELVEYCIENRERVVILLRRAEGTPFATFAADLRAALVGWAIDYARIAWPQVNVTPAMRFALACIYGGYVTSLAEALAGFQRADSIRQVVSHLSAHHLGGLKSLFETAANEGARHDRDIDIPHANLGEQPPRAAPRGARSSGSNPGAPAARAREPRRAGGARRRR